MFYFTLDVGGDGGGFYSSGAGNGGRDGKGFLKGGSGGQISPNSQKAGFGGFGVGGARSRLGGGGGGGYSGGNGGKYSCGGGGGSYNVGRNQQNNCCDWTSSCHGMVDITFLGNH